MVLGIPGISTLEWAGGVIGAPRVPSEAPGQCQPLSGRCRASMRSQPRMLREAAANDSFPTEPN